MSTAARFEKIIYWTNGIVIGLIVGFAIQIALAWTGPSADPPNANTDAPLTVGVFQSKAGGLALNNSAAPNVNGLFVAHGNAIVANGNMGIGTVNPQVKLDVAGKIRSQSTVSTDPGTTVVTKDYVDMIGFAPQNVTASPNMMNGHHRSCNIADGVWVDVGELMSCTAACNRICADICNGAVDPITNPRLCNGGDTNYTYRGGMMVEVYFTGATCGCYN